MLPFIAIAPLLMAAIALYVSISYSLMYIRRKDERENLWFSFMCITIALYDIFSSFLYIAQSPQQALYYQRWQFVMLALFMISITWFIASLVHINTLTAYIITIAMLVFCFLGFVLDSSMTLSSNRTNIKHFLLYGHIITYNEADPGLLYVIQYIIMLITGMYLLYKLFLYCKFGAVHIKILFWSMFVFVLASINDVLVGKGIYQFIYCLEYAYFFVICSMAYILQARFVKLHIDIEKLSFKLNQKLLEEKHKRVPYQNKNKILSTSHSEKTQHIVEYIHANYLYDISREGLSAMIDLHPDTLSRLFKQYTGKSLPDYINELRVYHAAKLLKTTDDSIVTIAFKTGFESLSTFNRCFNKVIKLTPSAYRQQHCKF
ncbi:MAG: helix-turn-helix domain-containing protein [Spirochaetota bacterium]